MLTAISEFLRRQLNYYKTDVVVVYAQEDDLAALPIYEELKRLYQDKKEIIFQKIDSLADIQSKRLTDIKNHIWLVPAEYGRIANVIDFLPLFNGQKVTVIQTFAKKQRVRNPLPEELEHYYSYIAETEKNMLDACIRPSIAHVISDALLYDKGFQAKDYEERLLRFAGLPSLLNSSTVTVNNKGKNLVPLKFEMNEEMKPEHAKISDTAVNIEYKKASEAKRLRK